MAKRKSALADKLASGGAQAPGWRDVVGSSQEAPAAGVQPLDRKVTRQRKTYLLDSDIIERVEQLAEQENVGINELARYLLAFALGEIEAGRHHLPTEKVEKRTIVS